MRVPPCPVLSSSLEAQALPPPLPTTLPFFVRPHPLQSTAALLEFNHSFLSEHFAVNVQFCARGIVDTLLGRDSSDISPSMDGAAPFFLVEYIWAHGLYLLLGNHSVHYPIQRTQSPTERKLVDVCLIQSFPNFFFFFFGVILLSCITVIWDLPLSSRSVLLQKWMLRHRARRGLHKIMLQAQQSWHENQVSCFLDGGFFPLGFLSPGPAGGKNHTPTFQ